MTQQEADIIKAFFESHRSWHLDYLECTARIPIEKINLFVDSMVEKENVSE